MDLAARLKEDMIFIADGFNNTDSFYCAYSAFLKEKGVINDSDTVKRLFIKREGVQSTGINRGAAAPHIFSPEFSEFTFSLALVREGIDFKAPDEQKVYLVFLIMSGERDVGLHLKSLAHIARLVRCTDIVEAARTAGTPEELCRVFAGKEELI